jgi:hypothetical protein
LTNAPSQSTFQTGHIGQVALAAADFIISLNNAADIRFVTESSDTL